MLNNKQKGTLCFAKSVWRQKKDPLIVKRQ